jgi:hypothetical protein
MAPPDLFRPILPDNDSAWNIRNCHLNLSNLWFMASILYYSAGMYREYEYCARQAIIHAIAYNRYNEIVILGHFLRKFED